MKLDNVRHFGRRGNFIRYRLFFNTLVRPLVCMPGGRDRFVALKNFIQRLECFLTRTQTRLNSGPAFGHCFEEIFYRSDYVCNLVLFFSVRLMAVVKQGDPDIILEPDDHRLDLRHGQHHRYPPGFFQQVQHCLELAGFAGTAGERKYGILGFGEILQTLCDYGCKHLTVFGSRHNPVVADDIQGTRTLCNIVVQVGLGAEQLFRDCKHSLFVNIRAAADDALDLVPLLEHPCPCIPQSQHAVSVADPEQQIEKRLESGCIPLVAVNEYFERILDLDKVLLDPLRHGRKKFCIQPANGCFRVVARRQEQLVEIVHLLDTGYAFAFRLAVTDVVEHIFQQILRVLRSKLILPNVDKQLYLAVRAAEQHLHADIGVYPLIAQPLEQCGNNRPETPDRLRRRGFLQRCNNREHALAPGIRPVIL